MCPHFLIKIRKTGVSSKDITISDSPKSRLAFTSHTSIKTKPKSSPSWFTFIVECSMCCLPLDSSPTAVSILGLPLKKKLTVSFNFISEAQNNVVFSLGIYIKKNQTLRAKELRSRIKNEKRHRLFQLTGDGFFVWDSHKNSNTPTLKLIAV